MKRRDNTDDLGSAIRQLMRSQKIKPKYYQTLIQHFFATEFGQYHEDIKSIKLYKQKLVIRVESAALRNELQFSNDLLRRRLNELLQEEFILEVQIR